MNKQTHCKRCQTELDQSNPATECGECDQPTLCLACAEDHACCVPDACLKCDAPTTLSCRNCPHAAGRTSEWLLSASARRSGPEGQDRLAVRMAMLEYRSRKRHGMV